MDLGESSLDNALAFDRVDPAEYTPWTLVNPEMVSILKQTSEARINKDPDFIRVKKEIAMFQQRKNRKTISLNLETRKKERIQDKIEEKKAEEVTSDEQPEGPIFPAGFYNNEVLRIGLDYLQFVRGMATAGK
jgi:carboxyl-terminal processing protease